MGRLVINKTDNKQQQKYSFTRTVVAGAPRVAVRWRGVLIRRVGIPTERLGGVGGILIGDCGMGH